MEKTEQVIFEQLGKLCVSPGYIQALAFICFNDNLIAIGDELSGEDFLKMYSSERLIRAEIMTLVGLMVKRPIDFTLASPATVQGYIDETQRLLKELHTAMAGPFVLQNTPENKKEPAPDPFAHWSAFREPIFYSGEAAYGFQLRDLALSKYGADSEWLERHKGFSIEEAHRAVRAFTEVQNRNFTLLIETQMKKPPSERSVLDGFSVTPEEIGQASGLDVGIAHRVLAAFTLPSGDCNEAFKTLNDFNVCTAAPLIEREQGVFILFSHHSLLQSLYESPFYWMMDDPKYKETASINRGRFAEGYVHERLVHVFGDNQVFQGVKILESKGKELTDIDVLALFGNRAIVLQAKSKKLTLEARKGNDGQIKADFKKAVQEAYNQGYESSLALLNPSAFQFRDCAGRSLAIRAPKEVFIVTVLSGPYPALTFQARQFLRFQKTDKICSPIVTDIFAIDAMTEMLSSPLWFVEYLRRRSGYSEKLLVPDELTALSFHLKRNLWLEEQYDMVHLTDDISCDLDAAMTVRREGMPGKRTLEGILTKLTGTTIERILLQIEKKPEPDMLEFAFTVLSCSEEAARKLSEAIDEAGKRFGRDGRSHNFLMGLRTTPATIVLVHCNRDAVGEAWRDLHTHCKNRKYFQKAEGCFGICVDPESKKLRFGIALEFPWEHDPAMDLRTNSLYG